MYCDNVYISIIWRMWSNLTTLCSPVRSELGGRESNLSPDVLTRSDDGSVSSVSEERGGEGWEPGGRVRSSEHHHGHQVRLGPLSHLVSPDHPVEGRVPPGVMALYVWNYKGFEGSLRNVNPNLAILSGVMRKLRE